MKNPNVAFDSDAVALMGRAFDDAWKQVAATGLFSSADSESDAKMLIAELIMNAAAGGQRDYQQLMSIALRNGERLATDRAL